MYFMQLRKNEIKKLKEISLNKAKDSNPVFTNKTYILKEQNILNSKIATKTNQKKQNISQIVQIYFIKDQLFKTIQIYLTLHSVKNFVIL